uniref:Glucose-methanol-choline oxidoreductase n=1 Tax=Caulobacter sp. (strain K31) TaxID=366602 RepID=B0T5J8_CAUSK
MSGQTQFDVIVVGSGITGGMAAKELTERGLKVLMIERGPMIEHGADYKTEMTPPWELPFRGYGDPQVLASDYPVQSKGRYFDEWTSAHFCNDRENPYQTSAENPFQWRRSYNLGGRSLVWGRQSFRWSALDFEANKKDGHGVDWPIRYEDLAPWYDHVETFIGVQGSTEHMPALPDGKFQPPFELNVVEKAVAAKIAATYPDRRLIISRSAHLTQEKEGRGVCQSRSICARGCSYGAYFSTQSASLPAAQATGRLTLITDSLVDTLDYDPATRRVTGVKVLDLKSKTSATYTAKAVFLCAGSFNSVALLLRSKSAAMPAGLANASGVLGQYIMDHVGATSAAVAIPGFADKTTFGNRPTGTIVPRFRNLLAHEDTDFLRGYSFFGSSMQLSWRFGESTPGLGTALKDRLHAPGQWVMALNAHGEHLPRAENRITLDPNRVDANGQAQLRIDFAYGDNEKKMLLDAQKQALAMLAPMGGKVSRSSADLNQGGATVHEMGGARMGRDPTTSVLNGENQAHEVINLFVTDGACMSSSASVNPSLTYMALTARACARAAKRITSGAL